MVPDQCHMIKIEKQFQLLFEKQIKKKLKFGNFF